MALSFAIPGVGSLGMDLGMGMPPLQLSSSASSGMDLSGSTIAASSGPWSVNVAGSGLAMQSAAAGGVNWWLVAAVAGGLWLWKHK